jgi:hypothetical protein
MTDYADFEIGLHRRDAENYGVELRFVHPGGDADVRLTGDRPAMVQFDFVRLRELALDSEAYGQFLAESLFADSEVRTAFAQAFSSAQSLDVPLRLRLFVGPSAPELHELLWETLRDPQDGSQLVTSEHVLFSRYLSSLDWRPVGLRPRADLRGLVVIASPAGLADWQPGGRSLAPLDVDSELERARIGLAGIPLTSLASGGSATLEGISTSLRDGFDVLYLACHGALLNGKPHLWLEDAEGNVDVVPGDELVTRLREMRQRPRLVVLASCQSAGRGEGDDEARSDDRGALSALGPRLAEAGIPAVLAMQGNVTMQTVAEFMPAFFRELQRDGLIDRAVSVARGTVRERMDWWVPVLFMRLKSGRLWYAPGFAEERRGLEKWPALLRNIQQGRCTPILGPALTDYLLGSRRQIAQRWAETYHFPMAAHDRENLPQVAQYLAVNQDAMFLRDELQAYVCREIRARYNLSPEDDKCGTSLNELVSKVGADLQAENPAEPHRVLAQFPLPVYITANFGNLLAEALADAGKEPKVELCRWNEYVEMLPSIYDDEPDYRPSAESPLIYHLFGHLKEPDSIVLTEDDYFNYLIGVTRDKDLIPGVVRRSMTDTALLFLGFRMDDWDFRVLFNSLMSQEGRRRRSRYAHVAVQIDPEEGRIQEPERARRYLESYFQDADISIYRGSVEDFIQELHQRWEGSNQ